jgi:hypothetical protein
MFSRLILLTIAVSAATLPAAAQAPAPTTTAFDGTYFGVSRTFEAATLDGRNRTWMSACTFGDHQSGRPAPLVIVNGIARSAWGGPAEGSVNPQGVLVMRTPHGDRFDGQIDGQGAVTGRFSGFCSYQFVWQKAPTSTTAFDGDYVGVSRESSCLANRVPVNLIIRNSVVIGGSWQGNVNPQGVVVMGNRVAPRVDGQIDSQGILRAQGSSSDGGCTVTFVWRKQSG